MRKLKNMLCLFIALTSINLSAQETNETLSSQIVGKLTCTYTKTINESKIERHHIYLSFNNLKYENITDLGGVMFMENKDKNKFVSDLKGCINFIDSSKSANKSIRFKGTNYELHVMENSKEIYLDVIDNYVSKYTRLSIEDANSLIKWLESVILPKTAYEQMNENRKKEEQANEIAKLEREKVIQKKTRNMKIGLYSFLGIVTIFLLVASAGGG